MMSRGNARFRLVSREMQLHIPQDIATVVELQELMNVQKQVISSQYNKPIMGIIQDGLVGCYLLTQDELVIDRGHFNDCVLSAGEYYTNELPDLFLRASEFYKPHELYSGRVLFSSILPRDFQYISKNNADETVQIINGILISGVVDSRIVGKTHNSIINLIFKEYGYKRTAEFMSSLQWLINRYNVNLGFSVGINDFIISASNKHEIKESIQKAYIEVKLVEESDEKHDLKEFKINSLLNNRGQKLAITGLRKNNRLETMVKCGSKGKKINIIQITGHLGQNNVEGIRIKPEIDDKQRTLPSFKRGDTHPVSRGFVEHSFMDGLSPEEFFMHNFQLMLLGVIQ